MQPFPYTHVEYPKWVTPPDGKARIVQTANEEAAAMAQPLQRPDAAPDDREALRQQARALGIPVDGRWAADRLKAEIEAATTKDLPP